MTRRWRDVLGHRPGMSRCHVCFEVDDDFVVSITYTIALQYDMHASVNEITDILSHLTVSA
jgi:hypothetical protein